MSRPVHPTLWRVSIAARSTNVSWSMQPWGRPNTDNGEAGATEAEVTSPLCSCVCVPLAVSCVVVCCVCATVCECGRGSMQPAGRFHCLLDHIRQQQHKPHLPCTKRAFYTEVFSAV